MADDFRIRLVAKNEGLEYEDPHGTYRFDLRREGKTWLVLLPGAKVGGAVRHHLTDDEKKRILPRVEADLKRIWWFGIWPSSYNVRFREHEQGS